MRLSPLFLSVLMFVTATDFAVGDHPGHGSSGGTASATQQTDRQLSRQMQRAHRADQLDTLRTRFGQGALSGDSAASAAQDRLNAVVQILPVDDPGSGATDVPNVSDGNAPQYLGPPITSDGGNGFWEGFPDDSATGDGSSQDKPQHGRGGPIIYTLGGAPGSQFHGNHNSGPGSADAPLFAPLNQLRGNARETPAVNHVPDALPSAQSTTGAAGHFDLTRADRIFAKRLADIDHLRDIALKNGNLKLLDRADKLEEIARSQYTRRGGTVTPDMPLTDPGSPVPDTSPEPPQTDPLPPTTDPLPAPNPVPPTTDPFPDPDPAPPIPDPVEPPTEEPTNPAEVDAGTAP